MLIESSLGRLYGGDPGIQNGGVVRMSGMSSMLFIALYRDGLTHYEPK